MIRLQLNFDFLIASPVRPEGLQFNLSTTRGAYAMTTGSPTELERVIRLGRNRLSTGSSSRQG
jgi:hypothetical protein